MPATDNGIESFYPHQYKIYCKKVEYASVQYSTINQMNENSPQNYFLCGLRALSR